MTAAEFRILHISDLHFGSHNDPLLKTLKSRVEELKPHVIVVTGDIANSPRKKYLIRAKEELLALESVCVEKASEGRPNIIVVPGNHDKMLLGNVMVLRDPFKKVFGGLPTSGYYSEYRIWIYGMDSARGRGFGGNGFVPDQALIDFRGEYDRLQKKYPGTFPESVFKIIALHHHPLPVNEASRNAKLQRWLTLMNAGALLGTALTHDIDLILHGHEHIDAQSTFASSLGGKSGIHVISMGATLKENEPNYMNLVVLGVDREVRLKTYQTNGLAFERPPAIREIRSVEQARDRIFDREVAAKGYKYREIASTTILTSDGDCRRIIECDGLNIRDPERARPHVSKIELPATTGHIDRGKVYVRPRRGRSVPDLSITHSDGVLSLNLGELTVAPDYSFEYYWWALNAFAMDEYQFKMKYDVHTRWELTHVHVTDPIEDLLVVVKFPDGFGDVRDFALPDNLFPCVTDLHSADFEKIDAKRHPQLEDELQQSGALRYIESLHIVALRVHQPVRGYSYGIGWRVPPLGGPETGGGDDTVAYRLLHRAMNNPHQQCRRFLRIFLGALVDLVRKELLPEWSGELEVSVMIYDFLKRLMVVVAAAKFENASNAPVEFTNNNKFTAVYGESVAGRAFKANRLVFWEKGMAEKRESADFYKSHPGGVPHQFLMSFPLREPGATLPFAVLSVGSAIPYRFPPERVLKLDLVNQVLSESCFQILLAEDSNIW